MAGDGGWFGKLKEACARLCGAGPLDPTGVRLPPARLQSRQGYVSLHFRRGQTQSRMRGDAPDSLLIDYTRTMLGALLWRPRPRCIGIVGLGGGSQVKFLHRHLPQARLEVVENHPGVIGLRRAFGIPDDDARLHVRLDDGARFIAARPARYDLLLVDGYDAAGIPAALSTAAFHRACRDALAAGGVMASNLHGDGCAPYIMQLRDVFGGDRVLVVQEAEMSNRVVFAWLGEGPRGDDADLQAVRAALDGDAWHELAPAFRQVARELALRSDPACAS
ncbi:transferase [Luteimonas sp. MJ246]|uniref:spermine/spermidine synthase domain-containing protein n=1 Tax=Luteimonas sp. MJ174 TaxID=3129237 RepID=UPI0031BA0DF3